MAYDILTNTHASYSDEYEWWSITECLMNCKIIAGYVFKGDNETGLSWL